MMGVACWRCRRRADDDANDDDDDDDDDDESSREEAGAEEEAKRDTPLSGTKLTSLRAALDCWTPGLTSRKGPMVRALGAALSARSTSLGTLRCSRSGLVTELRPPTDHWWRLISRQPLLMKPGRADNAGNLLASFGVARQCVRNRSQARSLDRMDPAVLHDCTPRLRAGGYTHRAD